MSEFRSRAQSRYYICPVRARTWSPKGVMTAPYGIVDLMWPGEDRWARLNGKRLEFATEADACRWLKHCAQHPSGPRMTLPVGWYGEEGKESQAAARRTSPLAGRA